MELIQGEAGVVVAHEGYLGELAAAAADALLIVDEVQTGMGRTGSWFAHEDVQPDLVTLAKGLGGGLPIGALLSFGDAADLLRPGHHGSTFGGNWSPAQLPWRSSTRSNATTCSAMSRLSAGGSNPSSAQCQAWRRCAVGAYCSVWFWKVVRPR